MFDAIDDWLIPRYSAFVLDFIERSKDGPFFLYMPFSHVHTTAGNQPQQQYASCKFQNTSMRGAFGDALSEVDWIIGNVEEKLVSTDVINNTLILFTGDNGPYVKHVTERALLGSVDLQTRYAHSICTQHGISLSLSLSVCLSLSLSLHVRARACVCARVCDI